MRSFVIAADSGQLQHAAAELGVTQQAVSKRVSSLERQLEVRLSIRAAIITTTTIRLMYGIAGPLPA